MEGVEMYEEGVGY